MKITEIPEKPKERSVTRVAAYARVSADKDAAFHSLEAQTEYYEAYVSAHPGWELVDIYSDNRPRGYQIYLEVRKKYRGAARNHPRTKIARH